MAKAKRKTNIPVKEAQELISLTNILVIGERRKKPPFEPSPQCAGLSLRKRMDVIMSQMKEYEETFGVVTKEFGNMIIVLAERLGDEATLKILQEAKRKLETQQTKKT